MASLKRFKDDVREVNSGYECGITLDGYNDITADELLCGFNAETKTAAAEDLIRELLSDGEKVPCETIFSMAASRGISQRTVNQAKKNIPEIVTTKPSKKWFWQIPK